MQEEPQVHGAEFACPRLANHTSAENVPGLVSFDGVTGTVQESGYQIEILDESQTAG